VTATSSGASLVTVPRAAGTDATSSAGSLATGRSSRADSRASRDDWPHTKRLMPWLIAGFIAMLWLVPFDSISMTVSLPFELKLDRIVLPFIVIAWCLAFAVGGKYAPRLRLTPIHIAVGTFLAIAFVSVIVNVQWLNTELLFNNSLKQLVLVSSYVSLFLMVASVVRPTEVRAFVKYTLILAVICGLGAIYEYRFHYVVFYQLAHTLMPSSLFKVPVPSATAIDELGRRSINGPADGPLELAAMCALALPLAMTGVMFAKRRRNQILYGIATCILLAAGFATYRKSAFVTPAIVILTLAVLRPRQVLRLLPLVPVLFIVVHVLAPSAIGNVLEQLTGSKVAAVGTTAHRTAAYDAVRPLVWTRPMFGQGYGSYNANLNRIFDSQILTSLIETGIVGLFAYLSMMITTFVTARSIFRLPRENPEVRRIALALGVGAIVFTTSSFLYDAMNFPHGPYIFLTYAGFIAVLSSRPRAPSVLKARGASGR
jgi:hypothetical protein